MGIFSLIHKLKIRFASAEKRAKIMRKEFYHCGKNVMLYTHKFGTEPYLISIHDNVICAAGVEFITHDLSVLNIQRFLKTPDRYLDKVGKIELFDNCFIGAMTILLPNTSVGSNSIVAAGSVVTKHIPDNEVWGGVPARFIMTTEEYAEKL